RFRLEEFAQRVAILGRRLPPISLDRVPALTKALLISVAVLRNDRSDLLRMRQRQAETYRGAVIEHIQGITLQVERLCEAVDDLRQVLECVQESLPARRVRKAKARKIGCDRMKPVGQQGNEIAKHVR